MINLISAAIGHTWAIPFENSFILWFQSLAGETSFLYYLMNFVSMFGEEMILVGIVGLIYWGFDKRRGEKIGFMMISATLFNPLIKNIVCRTRPFDSVEEIKNFRDVDGYSFPSGHSSGAASTYVGVVITYKDKKCKWLIAIAVIIPTLVALSRTYLGAHYPTDVIAGLALGVGLVFLVDFLYKVVPNKYFLYGGLLVIGLAGFFYCTTSDFYTGYGILLGFMCGILFEEKVTKFENTKVWWRIILRVLVGGGLFLGLNSLFKVVVGAIYPTYEDNVWFEHIFRTLRYAIVVYLVIGVYPLLFAQTEKLWKKIGWVKKDEQEAEQAQ
ncbi:MAG: phosphatase PAP2 family protein [Clostridiales bacterium]|nr:phosphatase PAP2 family protein [Clostridiales bacterium]